MSAELKTNKSYAVARETIQKASTALVQEADISLITSGEAVSTVEAMDVARKLAFHEQLQLHNLNTPLVEAGLAFPFQPEDIRRADPAECDVLTATQEVIHPEGSDHAMGLIHSTRGISADGKLLTGKFDSIFMTEEAYKEKGGKLVVIADKDTRLPEGEVEGRVSIEKGVLDEINGTLVELNRKPLDESLAQQKSDEAVVDFEVIPTHEKSNNFFYNRGHVGLVLNTNTGRSMILTKNALNERKEEGSVNMVRFSDNRYGIANTVRMLVGAGASYRPETARGYADINTAKMEKAMTEKYGGEWHADQVGMELGLAVKKALHVETHQLRQDYAYEDVTPKLQILEFDKDEVMRTAPAHIQHMMEEFEGLSPKKATAEELLGHIDSGKMVDGFSIGLFGGEFIEKGLIKVNPRYADNSIVLERRSLIQEGGKEKLVVPQGKAFDKGARTVGQVHPNTGNARFWYQSRVSDGNLDLLPTKGKFEKVSVWDVVNGIKTRAFSTVDSSVLFQTLYKHRILVPNF